MSNETDPVQIRCRNLWKVFGKNEDRILRTLDSTWTKDEILAQTGHVVAIKDVSFDVRRGEIFVIMGLSGSGKSTLIRCVSRLIEPTDGQVLLDGENVLGMNARQLRHLRRQRMSMIFQHFGLFPHRSVLDNVAYGLEVQGVDRATRHARAAEVLEMVGLAGWESHRPGQLSGGMQQRVGVARALAIDPDILLCDEPFSALDPLIRREMQDELLRLQGLMGKTILFITHDFQEAVRLGDRIAVMRDGEIVQIGTPLQLVTEPVDSYVAAFTREVSRTKILTAASLMRDCPVTVAESESPGTTRDLLAMQTCAMACVQSPEGRLLGVLSPGRVEQGLQEGVSTIASLVESPARTVSPATTLESILPHAVESNTPIPVVDGDERLLGIVEQSAVLAALRND